MIGGKIMKTKNLLNTKKQKEKVAKKLIEVFAGHSSGDLSLYLNGEIWDVDTKFDLIEPEYCKKCQNYFDNLQESSCWENLDTWGFSREEKEKAQKLIDYCHENHEGEANKDNPNYHGIRDCNRKKCKYQSDIQWSYKVKEVDHETFIGRVEAAYGNPDTITVVYDGNSACSTLEYNEFGGRDAFVSAIDSVIPEGYYYEYGTSWSLSLASLD